MKHNKAIHAITSLIYFVFLTLGIIAAYKGDWLVAMFFAITCAAETIAVSIDYIGQWEK